MESSAAFCNHLQYSITVARMDVNLSITLVMMESQMLPVATDHRDLLKYEHEHLAD